MKKPTKTRLRERLLPATLEHASGIAFYRNLWAGVDISAIQRVPDLALLPVVDKVRHREGLERAHHRDRLPSVLLHSWGTGGRPFIRYRSDEEIAALRHYFRTLTTSGAQADLDGSACRLVFSSLGASYHGNAVTLTDNALRVSIRVTDERGLHQALALITTTDLFPGREIGTRELHGNPTDLLILAHALPEVVADVSSLGIRTIVSVGDHLSKGARRLLADVFGRDTAIVDRYTASEIGAGSTLCSQCGAYHVDAHIVPEVVDVDTLAPLTTGRGLFVATELYPFSQFQPLIRYSTRDIVELVDPACDNGEISFIYIGRLDGSPTVRINGSTRLLVATAPFIEALEKMPQVRRRPLGRMAAHLPASSATAGPPVFTVDIAEDDPIRVTLRIGILAADGDTKFNLRAAVEAAALATAPDLAELVRVGQVQIVVETAGE